MPPLTEQLETGFGQKPTFVVAQLRLLARGIAMYGWAVR
jgi:hypothetical protein